MIPFTWFPLTMNFKYDKFICTHLVLPTLENQFEYIYSSYYTVGVYVRLIFYKSFEVRNAIHRIDFRGTRALSKVNLRTAIIVETVEIEVHSSLGLWLFRPSPIILRSLMLNIGSHHTKDNNLARVSTQIESYRLTQIPLNCYIPGYEQKLEIEFIWRIKISSKLTSYPV